MKRVDECDGMMLTAMHRTDLIQQLLQAAQLLPPALWQAALLHHPALWHPMNCSSAFVLSMCLSQTYCCRKVAVATVYPALPCALHTWLQSPSFTSSLTKKERRLTY